ncbi:MAG: class I SAM-dependent RNA methyltransferase [Myxococcales bacterium]|nr:class I SAM-dependent RNA methyltransferase [Myxococcales bacterium]
MPTLDLLHKPRHGELLEVEIDRLATDGCGEAQLEARLGPQKLARVYTVRVRHALPGERVRVRVERTRRREVEATLQTLLRAAPTRVEPRCVHFGAREVAGKGCGGCTLQSWDLGEQRRAKREMVARALGEAAGGVEIAPVVGVEGWHYRNKMELSFGDDRAREAALGLHPWGYRWEVFALEACYLLSPALAPIAQAVTRWVRERGVAPYRHRDDSGFLRTLTVREGKRTGERLVVLTTSAKARVAFGGGGGGDGRGGGAGERLAREVVGDFAERLEACARREDITLSGVVWTQHIARRGAPTRYVDEVLAGSGVLAERLELPGGKSLTFEIHPRAFFQPNTLGAERLYAEVLLAAGVRGELAGRGAVVRGELAGRGAVVRGELSALRVLDLYCGTGTISLCLAPYVGAVCGVELSDVAVANAAANAARNALEHKARFVCGDVAKVLRAQPELGANSDVVIVDPPRSGLTARALELVASVGAPRLVYVSCNPTALGRDLAALAGRYRPLSIQPVDMFPQTAHVETVVALERVDGAV